LPNMVVHTAYLLA